jgi:hypothetical protein
LGDESASACAHRSALDFTRDEEAADGEGLFVELGCQRGVVELPNAAKYPFDS